MVSRVYCCLKETQFCAIALHAWEEIADYQAQPNKPFYHEACMKDLLARKAKLNAALDLDKNEHQVAIPAEDDTGFAGESLPEPAPLPKVTRLSPPVMSL
jgi:hypothetical protein